MSTLNSTQLSTRIRLVRDFVDLPIKMFAEELGVSSTYMYGLESGSKENISNTLAELISTKFQVDKEWLLTGEGQLYFLTKDLRSNTGLACGYILNMIEHAKRLLEIHYSSQNNEHAINHIFEMKNGDVQFVWSNLNYDRRPRQLEISSIRNAYTKKKVPLFCINSDEALIRAIISNPNGTALENILKRTDISEVDEVGEQQKGEIIEAAKWSETPEAPVNIKDLTYKTIEVLESDTIYRTALASNINAFHQSIKMAEKMGVMESRMESFEQQTRTNIEELAQQIKALQEENRILKQRRSSEEDAAIIDASSNTSATDQPSSRKTT